MPILLINLKGMNFDFPGDLAFKAKLKKVQYILLLTFKKVHVFFEEQNYTYFMSSGTLLGSVRHKGFIPWDDDIDLLMLEDDFERLRRARQQNPELGKAHGIRFTFSTNNNWHIGIRRIAEPNYGIDIFPLQRYRFGTLVNLCKRWYTFLFYSLAFQNNISGFFPDYRIGAKKWWKCNLDFYTEVIKKKMRRLLPYRFLLYPFLLTISNPCILILAFTLRRIIELCQSKTGKYIHGHSKCVGIMGSLFPICYDDIFPLRRLEFENDSYFAPNHYDKVLRNGYDNYNQPPKYEHRKPQHLNF